MDKPTLALLDEFDSLIRMANSALSGRPAVQARVAGLAKRVRETMELDNDPPSAEQTAEAVTEFKQAAVEIAEIRDGVIYSDRSVVTTQNLDRLLGSVEMVGRLLEFKLG